ncbi:MAG TPA: LamG domain-containing protein, partial [Acidimicrobiales bacterium]|nr:LamG domain-containing protein [Acidimicrobiales bacterium]
YPSAYLSLGSAATAADSQVFVATSPASVYAGSGASGLWHFDEGSGVSALDSSGNGDAGALLCAPGPCASTPTYVAGRPGMGTALDFSGLIGGMVRISSGPQFGFTNALTVCAWVLPQSASMAGNAAVVVKGPLGSEDWFLRVTGGHYQFGVTAGGGRASVLSNASVSVGQWTSLIGVFDGAAQKLKLYVNGSLDNASSGVPPPIAVSTQPVTVGAGQASSGGVYSETFTGAIDEVQAAAAAYSDAQALAYYQGASVSTVAVTGSGKVLIGLPPNAFGAPAVIYASQDPINHPLTVDPAILQAGLLNLPTGQLLIPGSLVEIVPVVNGAPFTSPLGSSATIGLPFSASGGLVAGTSPPVPA